MSTSGVTESPTGSWRGHVAIALVSAAVMLYEIAITRVLSVVLWYHFAFLAISLAMLGLGVPGVWFALRGAGPRSLERALLASALLVPLSIVVLFQLGGHVRWLAALATVSVAAPLLALGSAICLLLLRTTPGSFGAMYGADLIGATLGALLVVPLMHVVPTPVILAGSALLPALALVVIGRARLGMPALAAIGVLVAWGTPLHLRYSKLTSEKDLHPQFEKWTPTARLLVFPQQDSTHPIAGWGMGARYVPRPFDQLWLELDGAAATPITRLKGSPAALEHLAYDVTSLGYQIQPPNRVNVIGGGGGRDILTALAAGAREVDAVELNPHIVDLVSRRFGAYSGDVYHLPGVHTHVGEGRAFLTRSPSPYDMIQISMVDSWAATAAGAFALSENYLYTVQAYQLYWRRLSDTGMISTSRWARGERLLETLRLAHLVLEAMQREGVREPNHHIAIAHAGRIATVLASRQPFDGPLYRDLVAVCERRGFVLDWPPATPGDTAGTIVSTLALGPQAFLSQGVDLSPPVDDRPFFFQNVVVFGPLDRQVIKALSPNENAVVLLRWLMALVSAIALVLFFLPFALGRALDRGSWFWRGSIYFALIGLGFMLVEIPMIQKMILYLGHPSHATTVVLTSILLGAGLGSAASGRLSRRGVLAWAVALPAALAIVNLLLGRMLPATMAWPWLGRAAVAFGIAAPVGFLMGFALPLGMRRTGPSDTAWFWAVNGACGVVASVCSLALSMAIGFDRVLWLGAGLYLIAVVVLLAPGGTAMPAPSGSRALAPERR